MSKKPCNSKSVFFDNLNTSFNKKIDYWDFEKGDYVVAVLVRPSDIEYFGTNQGLWSRKNNRNAKLIKKVSNLSKDIKNINMKGRNKKKKSKSNLTLMEEKLLNVRHK